MFITIGALIACGTIGIKLAVIVATTFLTLSVLMGLINGLFSKFRSKTIATVPGKEIIEQGTTTAEKQQITEALEKVIQGVPRNRIHKMNIAVPMTDEETIAPDALERAEAIDAKYGSDSDCEETQIFVA